MIQYAFFRDQCIAHATGWFTPDDVIEAMREAVKHPRWVPGKTILMVMNKNKNRVDNLFDAQRVAKALAKNPPRMIALMSHGEVAELNVDEYAKIFRLHGINAKGFTDLQEMFDWVERGNWVWRLVTRTKEISCGSTVWVITRLRT